MRYLKYLVVDWQGFTEACERVSMSDPLQETLTCSGHGDVSAQACESHPLVETISLANGHRLVEYDSSDESEHEDMEISKEPGPSLCEEDKSSQPQIAVTRKESSDSTGLLSGPNSLLERQPLLVSHRHMAPLSGQLSSEASSRAVVCLSELRAVVARLHSKKLFPYKPSSLLKLLAQVEICFQQSHMSH